MALTEKLTAIATAIRNKTSKPDLLTLDQMPAEIEGIKTGAAVEPLTVTSNGTYTAPEGAGYSPIDVNVPQDGAPTKEELTLSGDVDYAFANDNWSWYINKYGNQITTKDIMSANSMFASSERLFEIPFCLNFKVGRQVNCTMMFAYCANLKHVPIIKNCRISQTNMLFAKCSNVVEFPVDFANGFDYSFIDNQTSLYSVNSQQIFWGCYRLRKAPIEFLKHGNPVSSYSYSTYSFLFSACYCLDEVIDLPNPHYKAVWTSDVFGNTFRDCYRLKRLTFDLNNTKGEPNIVKWKNQTLDLSNGVGYGYCLGYLEDAQYKIHDDATYQQYKDNPDSWTEQRDYSRYNRTSAVETLKTLPDASAYLATAGGTNTIKFQGAAGCRTDGGAINTMTEEEIAQATARGWTVAFV